MSDLPIDTKGLIPHQPPMKMVDRIISYSDADKSSVLELTIAGESPFVDNKGQLAPECYLEIIAQAAAAQHGFNLHRDGAKEEQGFLVGARNVNITGQAKAGDILLIKVACGIEIESVSSVSGNIYKGEEEIASAQITVWHGSKS